MIDNDYQQWKEITLSHPVDFFTTVAGQELAHARYFGVKRPPGWSLPAELGPWSDSAEEVTERILCLLPGVSDEIVGDFLSGPWRTRSATYRPMGQKVLASLRAKGRAVSSPGRHWEEWRATMAFVQPLKASDSHSAPARAFLDRLRLAYLDQTSFRRLNERRVRDIAHLDKLRQTPPAQRNEALQAEIDLYEEIIAAWESPKGT